MNAMEPAHRSRALFHQSKTTLVAFVVVDKYFGLRANKNHFVQV
jgi:hypothetical protein